MVAICRRIADFKRSASGSTLGHKPTEKSISECPLNSLTWKQRHIGIVSCQTVDLTSFPVWVLTSIVTGVITSGNRCQLAVKNAIPV